jgi:hypothetical protein
VNIERKTSGQFPREGDESDVAVISIAPTSLAKPVQTQGSMAASAGELEPSLPSLSTSYEEVGTCDGNCGSVAPHGS